MEVNFVELRPNNIVKNEKSEEFFVRQVSSDKIICESIDNTGQFSEFNINELSYIKLDVKWLKRLRFILGMKSNRVTIYNDGWFSPYIKAKNGEVFKIRLVQEEDGFVFNINGQLLIAVEYVHELQNLYKILAKKELSVLKNDNKSIIKL